MENEMVYLESGSGFKTIITGTWDTESHWSIKGRI